MIHTIDDITGRHQGDSAAYLLEMARRAERWDAEEHEPMRFRLASHSDPVVARIRFREPSDRPRGRPGVAVCSDRGERFGTLSEAMVAMGKPAMNGGYLRRSIEQGHRLYGRMWSFE